MSKRPALLAPDLASLPRALPKTPTDEARFSAAEALEAPDSVARRVQQGSVRVINTDTSLHRATPETAKEPTYTRGPEVALSTKIPEYVAKQLRLAAAQRDTTIRNLILEALKKDGLEIQEQDIQDDRKRR